MSDLETQRPSPRSGQEQYAPITIPRPSQRSQSTLQTQGQNTNETSRRHSTMQGRSDAVEASQRRRRRQQSLQGIRASTEARHRRLDQYQDTPDSTFEHENEDSEMPLYDEWYSAEGSEGIRSMTGFTGSEFQKLYEVVHEAMKSEFSTGRGRRSKFANGDILLMTLTTLKAGTDWETASRPFDISTSSFIRLVPRCIECIASVMYAEFVESVDKKYQMHSMLGNERTFESFKHARYATDVMCQQINRPTGNIEEVKNYYSGKHKYYGLKLEVSVLPNGLAITSSDPYCGSVADIRILRDRRKVHRELLKKNSEAGVEEDEDPLHDEHSTLYAMLCDKGYQGAAEFLRCIHPYKRLRNRSLTDREEAFNARHARDRIIVEHFFGRMEGLWGVMDHKWRLSHDLYMEVSKLCIALTNFHIEHRPLRREDYGRFNRARNRRLSLARFQIQRKSNRVRAYVQSRRERRAEQSLALHEDE